MPKTSSCPLENNANPLDTVKGPAFSSEQAPGSEGHTSVNGAARMSNDFSRIVNPIGVAFTLSGSILSGNQAVDAAGRATGNGGNSLGSGDHPNGQSTLTVTGRTIVGYQATRAPADSGGANYFIAGGVMGLDAFTVIAGHHAFSDDEVFGVWLAANFRADGP